MEKSPDVNPVRTGASRSADVGITPLSALPIFITADGSQRRSNGVKIAGSAKGFSLVEIIIVLSLFLIIGAAALPVGIRVFQRQIVVDDLKNAARLLRSAQSLSMYQKNDSQFGVAFLAGNMVLFQGASYSARTVSEDRLVPLSPGVVASGPSEIVFAKLTGISSINSIITFTLGLESDTIAINRREINF